MPNAKTDRMAKSRRRGGAAINRIPSRRRSESRGGIKNTKSESNAISEIMSKLILINASPMARAIGATPPMSWSITVRRSIFCPSKRENFKADRNNYTEQDCTADRHCDEKHPL